MPARPVQALEPVGEGLMDERPDILVPVQVEDLPQGVLDLLAALLGSPRPWLESGRGVARYAVPVVEEGDAVQHRGASPSGTVATAVVREQSRTVKLLPQASPLSDAPMPALLRPEIAVEHVNSPTQSVSMEPTPDEPSAVVVDEPLRPSPPSPQVMRPVPNTVPASLPPAVMLPAPDVTVPTPPDVARGLLQVPFNNGAASGQVTIHRLPEESARLMLRPSDALVFEQLREPFAQARESAWRLTDSGGEQPRQGSQQAPDDDQDEAPERPA
ncbi:MULTISPECIES: SpaN/EivJ family type III secretion system needle length determinant [unclassified Pseudomonas]|uniref:SpaN/EivJ family type III secretion system needle length determinant n=1 Tax=unclassified Pseudomonas TaxID=196821 RepID=UPI0039B78CF1